MKAPVQGVAGRLKRGIPILSWGPQHRKEWLRPDAIAHAGG
jgi:hypothetical protein